MKKFKLSSVLVLTVLFFINAEGGCGGTETGLTGPIKINHNMTREYYLYVPASYSKQSGPVPLIVDFHGFTSTAQNQFEGSGFDAIADEEGLLVAYPQGFSRSWNAREGCCSPASLLNVDDIGFTRAVIEDVRANYPNVDVSRIYATGLSNGASMANRLAMEASDVFAAMVAYAHYLLTDVQADARPIATLEIHAYNDGTVDYYPSNFEGAQANFELWANHNMCAGLPEVTELSGPCGGDPECHVCETYTNCAGGVEVGLCSLSGGHQIYSNNSNIDVTRIGWDFMRKFRLP